MSRYTIVPIIKKQSLHNKLFNNFCSYIVDVQPILRKFINISYGQINLDHYSDTQIDEMERGELYSKYV